MRVRRILLVAVVALLAATGLGVSPTSAATLTLQEFFVNGGQNTLSINFAIPTGAVIQRDGNNVATGIQGLTLTLNDGTNTTTPTPQFSTSENDAKANLYVTGLTQRTKYTATVSLPVGSDTYSRSGVGYTMMPTAGTPDVRIDGKQNEYLSASLDFGGNGATYTWLFDGGGFYPNLDYFGDHLTYGTDGTVTGTTPAAGWEQFTVSATGGTAGAITKTVWIVISQNTGVDSLKLCSDDATAPCVKEASIGGTAVTSLSGSPLMPRKFSNGMVDFFIRLEGTGATDTTEVDVTFDMGTTPRSAGYFLGSSGRVKSLSVSTVGGRQLVRVVTTPMWASWVANTYPGPYCQIGNCAADLVGGDDLYTASAALTPTGTQPQGIVSMPTDFAGGWIASNAQSSTFGAAGGTFTMDLAAPHYRKNGTTVNTGFFDINLPRAVLDNFFGLTGVTETSFREQLRVLNQTNGGTAQDETMTVEAADFNNGLRIFSNNVTYSWHKYSIAAVSSNGSGGGSSGGSGGSSGGGGASAPAETPASTPAATPTTSTPAATPAVTPVVVTTTVPSRNPQTAQVVASGVTVVSQTEAAAAADRTMKNPAAAALGKAPNVNATAGQALALVVPAQTPNTSLDVKIKVNGKYVALGTVASDASGRVALPVFKPTKPGTYTVAIVNPATGKTSYIKVVVKPTKKR